MKLFHKRAEASNRAKVDSLRNAVKAKVAEAPPEFREWYEQGVYAGITLGVQADPLAVAGLAFSDLERMFAGEKL